MTNNTSPIQIYNASAGSGKTYSLVKNILSLLLQADSPSYIGNIMAVTFTNKAANEMKSRLIKNLRELSSEDYQNFDMLPQLEENTGMSAEEIHLKAKNIFQYILHHYSLLNVSTIDKFNLNIIKKFSKELDLSYGFGVEIDNSPYYQEAYDSFLNSFDERNPLFQSILNYFFYSLDNEKSIYSINKEAKKKLQQLEKETDRHYLLSNIENTSEEELISLRKKILSEQNSLQTEIKKLAGEALALMDSKNLQTSDFAGGANGGLRSIFQKIHQKGVDATSVFGRYEKFEEGRYLKKDNMHRAQEIEEILPSLVHIYEQINTLYSRYILNKEINKDLLSIQIAIPFQKILNELKNEEDVIFISDFNTIISEHLSSQPSAFIYEKLGNTIDHYFLDEFQDTSALQWSNFTPLVTEISSQAGGNTVSIIGDPKQSIYRFRGGKPEIMLEEIHKADDEKNAAIYTNHFLDSNYRSAPEIVHFNNELYTYLSESIADAQYQEMFGKKAIQKAASSRTGGYIQLSVLNPVEYKERQNEKILEIIKDCQSRGIPLNKVAILTRTNSTAQDITDYLRTHAAHIQISSEEALLLENNDAVQSMVHLLRCIQDANNQDSFFQFLVHLSRCSSLIRGAVEEEIVNLCLQKNPLQHFQKKYEIALEDAFYQSIDLYNGIEALVRILKFDLEYRNFMVHFLDYVLSLQSQQSQDIQSFLDNWDENHQKIKISAPNKEDALNIMTIHKAKGLEFEVVIISDIPIKNNKYLWIPIHENIPELQYISTSTGNAELIGNIENGVNEKIEELQLQNEVDTLSEFYVATTRSIQEMYILLDYSNQNYFHQFLVSRNMISPPADKKEKESFQDIDFIFPENATTENYQGKNESKNKEITVSYYSADWQQRLKIAMELQNYYDSQAIEKGNTFHTLLSMIYYTEDITFVLENAKTTGFIDEEESKQFEKIFTEICNHSIISKYFTKEFTIYNEREYLKSKDSYRPDRVMIQKNTYTIIDYKTGVPSNKDKKQVEQYRQDLLSFGKQVDKVFLVYIEGVSIKVEEVKE